MKRGLFLYQGKRVGKRLLSSEGSTEPDCVSGFSLTEKLTNGLTDQRTNLR